jgi:hypothetical protein
MHETVVAQIDADMGERAVEGIEEDQVAWLEFFACQRLGRLADRAAVARQRDAGRFPEHVADEAAAVEAAFGRCPAQPVGAADQAYRIQRHLAGGDVGACRKRQREPQQQEGDKLHRMQSALYLDTANGHTWHILDLEGQHHE